MSEVPVCDYEHTATVGQCVCAPQKAPASGLACVKIPLGAIGQLGASEARKPASPIATTLLRAERPHILRLQLTPAVLTVYAGSGFPFVSGANQMITRPTTYTSEMTAPALA